MLADAVIGFRGKVARSYSVLEGPDSRRLDLDQQILAADVRLQVDDPRLWAET